MSAHIASPTQTSFFHLPARLLNRFALVAILIATALFVSGCVSSSSNTATYGGPSISSTSAKQRTAQRDVKKAKRDLRSARRDVKAIEKKIKRTERKLRKRKISKSAKAKLKKSLRKDKKALRTAKRDIRNARRSVKRAERAERKAGRDVAAAKRRMRAAEKRLAAEKKRQAEVAKKKSQEEAQQAFARQGSQPSYAQRLFGSSDPALKNISDYQARVDGGFQIAAIPVDKVSKRLLRQEVRYRSRHKPGTIVVDTGARYLYLVQSSGKALRYGIGVGRQGFSWSGTAHIGWKQEWPKWTPPEEMIEREPHLAKYCADCGGMPGGPKNPLGARALYLMKDGKDTLYRLHGTPQWASIGTAASSGCIRLMNQDIIDLYGRTRNGAKVVVL